MARVDGRTWSLEADMRRLNYRAADELSSCAVGRISCKRFVDRGRVWAEIGSLPMVQCAAPPRDFRDLLDRNSRPIELTRAQAARCARIYSLRSAVNPRDAHAPRYHKRATAQEWESWRVIRCSNLTLIVGPVQPWSKSLAAAQLFGHSWRISSSLGKLMLSRGARVGRREAVYRRPWRSCPRGCSNSGKMIGLQWARGVAPSRLEAGVPSGDVLCSDLCFGPRQPDNHS